jgi:hypothetical protein
MSRIYLRWVGPVAIGAVMTIAMLRLAPMHAVGSRTDGSPPAPPSAHPVVLAELFTSEGCSSCPPADAVLSMLVHDQPLSSVEVVGLGEHVDYWDRLGWRDPYSSASFSNRQAEYGARVFHTADIYTPQIVIDGQYEAVGSDIAAIRKAIVRAASVPKAMISLEAGADGPAQIAVHAQVTSSPGVTRHDRGDIIVALVSDRVSDDVTRGENRGKRLTHSAVVRSLTTIGSMAESETTATAAVTLHVAPEWKTNDARLVAFVQERRSRRVLGTTSLELPKNTFER